VMDTELGYMGVIQPNQGWWWIMKRKNSM
jgi:hypothetical protein